MLKTNARIVYIVQSSDKHACKYWRDHGMSFASMISTSQPPSSFLMKSMNNLMEDTDDRSAAIPSLTSIYRQISKTIICVVPNRSNKVQIIFCLYICIFDQIISRFGFKIINLIV